MAAWLRMLLAAMLAGLLAAALTLLLQQQWRQWQQPAVAAAPVKPVAIPARTPFSYADAVAAAAPSVVSIRTAIASKPQEGNSRVSVGLGSGVIWREDGLIITNYHVVRQAEAIAVELRDGRTLRADVVGTDPATDLALLRVNADKLQAIANPKAPARVGDVVLAIGYPFLLGQTVTIGIVSATERLERGFIRLIQTDAAINRGNSGGALVNARGEWVGINSEVLPAQLGVQGIGFAIPSDYVIKIVDQILTHGRVVRGSIGFVGSGSANEIRSDDSDNKFLNAVRIDSVDPNGSAAAAGLQPGDWITHFNGELIGGVTDLLRRIADTTPGNTVQLRVWRGSEMKEFAVAVSERSPELAKPDEKPARP
ncbi:PDZ domain-containing protein [Permianibacter sp. IMCC34836]|uniref:S1C family serine protease n=1 Tax=Permianibacter fluminis TaxID=2738515 RepID=UPI0015563893|nr:trypsin-like peptidase domain-containing protein [Permianibacter fluminis]NQD39036.1 PDZ domain-containing protein [Permianibacter fluminis]